MENILRFIGIFGSGISVATKIDIAMRRDKKQEPITMLKEELELVHTLNSYYRKKLNLSFDVLDTIKFKSGMRFEKQVMQDLNKPAQVDFRHATALYVPLLRNPVGEVQYKATIKGGK